MRAKKGFVVVLVLNILACTTQKSTVFENGELELKRVSKSVFRHISFLATDDFGKVGCNGILVVNGGEALLIDSPTNDTAAALLLDWIGNNLKCKVIGVVATHFHDDCLGGFTEFHKRQIPTYASFNTITLAKANGNEIPQIGFNDYLEINVGDKKVMAGYFGEGHTQDNVVAYFPSEKVLFGGCLVKAIGASKGYLGDANTKAWPNTVSKVKSSYKDAKIVVPGHGDPGGMDLLEYTIGLFKLD